MNLHSPSLPPLRVARPQLWFPALRAPRRLLACLSLLSLLAYGCEDDAESGGEPQLDGAAPPPSLRLDRAAPPIAPPTPPATQDQGPLPRECDACDTCAAAFSCECPDSGERLEIERCGGDSCCLSEAELTALCSERCAAVEPPPRECTTGESRCLAGEPGAVQQCDREGQWRLMACPAGQACTEGRCLPEECTPGEALCLDGSDRLECDADGMWRPSPPCDAEELCAEGRCESVRCANAIRERSYLGCEYLALELPNLTFTPGEGSGDAASAVVLSNPDGEESARVTVRAPGGGIATLVGTRQVSSTEAGFGPVQIQSEVRDRQGAIISQGFDRAENLEIPPGGLATLILPRQNWTAGASQVVRAAHRVQSDRPVSAYQFNPYCCNFSFSNDASLLIPTSALDQQYRFLGVPTWLRDFTATPSPAALVVVAKEDDTRVEIQSNAQTLPDATGRLRGAGVGRLEVTLNADEVLLLRSGSVPAEFFQPVPPQPDLSGSFVEASAPVALFSTHDCAFYPSELGACDHLEEQLFPISTWGRQFALVPPVQRSADPREKVYWKIVAEGEGAQVRLSNPVAAFEGGGPGYPGVPSCVSLIDPADPLLIRLGPEGYCELSARQPLFIEGDQNLMVLGVISGQGSTGSLGFGDQAGDPAIFLVPPARQFRRSYNFLAPDTYANDFVTLVFTEGTQVNLDGGPIDLSGATPIPGSGYAFQHLSIEDGAHELAGSGPFGILVFAFDDFVSYAFTGGLNLTKR